MADKYVIEGATYCGDGTASNEAASAGAAGAWNSLFGTNGVLEGNAPLYGSVAAGDVIYIRSKTSGGVDITRTLSASVTLGNASATDAAWIRWVIDDGTLWSNANGTVQYDCPSTYIVTLRNYNSFEARTQDRFVIRETNASANNKYTLTLPLASNLSKTLVDLSYATASGGAQIACITNTSSHTFHEVHIKSYNRYGFMLLSGDYGVVQLFNPDIELLNAAETEPVFQIGQYGSRINLFGGRIRGPGAISGVKLCAFYTAGSAGLFALGTDIPRAMDLVSTYPPAQAKLEALGLDGGMGAVIVEKWGAASTRKDNNPPKLNAYLPDSASTKFSWWVFPDAATISKPMQLSFPALYTGADAAKVVTLNYLLATGWKTANAATLWVDLFYVDTSGVTQMVSTRDYAAGALTSSDAVWSIDPPTWGAVSFHKRKFAITTPTAIKQDTMVTAILRGTINSVNADDILFVCPDLILTTP